MSARRHPSRERPSPPSEHRESGPSPAASSPVSPLGAGHIQVTTSIGSREDADRIAATVVRERLAACAQVQGPITSTFPWKGRVDSATEWYCHLKTTGARFPALAERIRALHPYDVPEIIALPILGGTAEYLAWIEDAVRPT